MSPWSQYFQRALNGGSLGHCRPRRQGSASAAGNSRSLAQCTVCQYRWVVRAPAGLQRASASAVSSMLGALPTTREVQYFPIVWSRSREMHRSMYRAGATFLALVKPRKPPCAAGLKLFHCEFPNEGLHAGNHESAPKPTGGGELDGKKGLSRQPPNSHCAIGDRANIC